MMKNSKCGHFSWQNCDSSTKRIKCVKWPNHWLDLTSYTIVRWDPDLLYDSAVGPQKHFTKLFKNELTSCLKE